MSEMALTADHLIVIGRGRLIADSSVEEVIRGGSRRSVLVRSRDDRGLAARLEALGAGVVPAPAGGLFVSGVEPGTVGEAALAAGIVVEELTPQRVSLEEAFMELTRGDVEFAAGILDGASPSGSPGASGPR